MDTKELFMKEIGEMFNTDCNKSGFSSQCTFTELERSTFLDHLWEKFSTYNGIDLESPPAIAAMMRARRGSDSVQVQMGKFPAFLKEEIIKAQQQGKK